jgi:hypothetical protein
MGIGLIGISQNLVFKRKFRWSFRVDQIGGNAGNFIEPYWVKVANRPNVTVEETEINFMHGKMYIPGKATFDAISITYYDIASKSTTTLEPLYDWIGTVFDFLGPEGTRENANMSSIAEGQGGYSALGSLELYDGCGQPLEQWTLQQCWPQAVNFGDLDYSNNEENTIEVTLRYQWAQYQRYCGTRAAQPSCVGCFG